ncbi:MAG: tetratricopeptide repeat protein [Burkholderiales bacterium]|nr:tetratricopeptide repeat protein [Burkholderiales bacterium]
MFKNLLNRILSTPASRAPTPAPVPATTLTPTPALAPAPALPDDVAGADALIAEGNALEDAGQLARAEALYRQAVAKAPGHARAHLNLGIALAAAGDEDGASAAYERVLAIDPAHPFGNYNYARLALVRGDLARAEALIAAAVRAKPDFAQALVVQSNVLDARGQAAAAIAAIEAALRLRDDDAGAWYNLGTLLMHQARADEAEPALRRALELDAGNVDSLAVLARVQRDQGFAAEALATLGPVVERLPQSWPDRSLELLLTLFADGLSQDEIFRRHARFGADLEQAVPARFQHAASPAPKRLRVGYLSADLVLHPVTFFLLPVLEQHDRAQVEVFCYAFGKASDGVTDRIRALSDHWRDVAALDDTQIADRIHADGIDVLVDLAGHTGVPRLGVFAQKPAPVQVSWVGYLGTTGLTRMDYRLCDGRTDPIALAQPRHTERLVHLPTSQWCYRPMLVEEIGAAPFERNGHLTFGSFNAALKLSDAVLQRWGEALARLPGSRLLVANVNSERKRAAIREALARRGVAGERVEFLARVPLNRYFDLYNGVDIALDSFPYGGGTTTLDALWMGVPVATAVGETSVSRSAASVLAEVGLDDWIAPSLDDFVDRVVARASDRDALRRLRRELRPRLQASPITDMPRFVRDLEAAYRAMRGGELR